MSLLDKLKSGNDAADPVTDHAVLSVASALASSRWTTAILVAVAVVAIVMWASCGCPDPGVR